MAVSPEVGDYLVEVTGVPRKHIKVISNGVARPRKVKQEEVESIRALVGADDDTCLIGSVGRMEDESHKRFGDFLEAVKVLRDSGRPIRAVLVGDGKVRGDVERHARELGLQEAVYFAGFQEDTAPWYQAMDVFALASEREAFGLVLVEAMWAGLPVVATGVGGMRRIVVAGETGFLAPVRDVQSIAESLGQLADDVELRNRMGLAGLHRAESEYSEERYVGEVASLYDDLINERASRRTGLLSFRSR